MPSRGKVSSPSDVTLASSDGRLKVVFQWRADRFVQSVFADGELAGTSLDGDGQTDWPASPPIQQLSLETINDASVVLGVGGAGRAHWSISVECVDESSLKFDLACRVSGEFGQLASSYRASEMLTLTADDGVAESLGDELWRISPTANQAVGTTTRRWVYRLSLA